MGTLLLVRHGESRWNDEGRVQGWAPVGLTATGREQAAAVGTLLDTSYDVDTVVSSDVRRARETAAVVADAVGADSIREDSRWRERDFGALQGLPADGLLDRYPELDLLESEAADERRPMGGESWRDVQHRVRDAFTAFDDGTGTTVVVTHFAPILLVVGAVRDEDLTTALTERRVTTGSMTELRRADGEWAVAAFDRQPTG